MTTIDSVSFDRATDYYDRTRSLSEEAMAAVVALLSEELIEHQPCLEIGVGTGRIALPLGAEGIDVWGIDLAEPMLAKLVDKAAGRAPFPLAVADATALPFPDDCFGAGIACHVLHLIPGWRRALTELLRVVRPGGVFLSEVEGWGSRWMRELHERFAREARLPSRRPGAQDADDVDQAMTALGARGRVLPPIHDVRRLSAAQAIDDLEAGLYSNTWTAPPEVRARAATVLRRWARTELGNLDDPRTERRTIAWRAYDLPSGS
jgi:SAM-dependent methyltransferase